MRSSWRSPTPGLPWADVQCAFGGSLGGRADRSAHQPARPDRHPVHERVQRLRHRRPARSRRPPNAIRSRCLRDIAVAVGMDKHPRGSFKVDPTLMNMPTWYGENGQYVTTKFFGMKINKYMHDHGISAETLAKVAAKNYRNGVLNPKAFRRKAISEEEILASPMLNHPLTAYMFCAPDEGAAALVMCRADIAHRYTDSPDLRPGGGGPHSELRRLRGQHELGCDRRGRVADGVRVAGRLREGGHRAGGRRRDPAPGHRRGGRGHPHGRERLLRRRRAGEARRRRRDGDRRARCR